MQGERHGNGGMGVKKDGRSRESMITAHCNVLMLTHLFVMAWKYEPCCKRLDDDILIFLLRTAAISHPILALSCRPFLPWKI